MDKRQKYPNLKTLLEIITNTNNYYFVKHIFKRFKFEFSRYHTIL